MIVNCLICLRFIHKRLSFVSLFLTVLQSTQCSLSADEVLDWSLGVANTMYHSGI